MTTLSKRELLLQLLELEGDKVGDLGKDENISKAPEKPDTEITITETAVVPLTKPKKQLTEKQLEALKKGQENFLMMNIGMHSGASISKFVILQS